MRKKNEGRRGWRKKEEKKALLNLFLDLSVVASIFDRKNCTSSYITHSYYGIPN
jgi:hypothetical protein